MDLTRGDIVILAVTGDYGKPRPAVIVQSDLAAESHSSFIVCLMTTTLRDAPLFRIRIEPSPTNGLRQASEIMVDKIQVADRIRIRQRIGTLTRDQMVQLEEALRVLLDLH